MSDMDEYEARLHSAGATVRHRSPFSALAVPTVAQPFPAGFVEKWILPFYRTTLGSDSFRAALAASDHEIDEGVAATLLAYCNWRPRRVGALFAAVKNYTSLEDNIGRLLKRSDLCCVGDAFCLVLAHFNTASARKHLTDYLDYYLLKADLWFDQGPAMAAVGYLDRQNGTKTREDFLPR